MKKLIWTLIVGLALWSCNGNLLNNPLGSVTVSISAGPTLINGVDTMGITWNSNVASRHMVEYGTVSGSYTKASPATSAESMDHLETLIDLVSSTTYFYRITSFYQTSFQKVSQEYSFITNAFTQPSGITAIPGTTSVTVNWTTSLSAKGSIDLGTTIGVYDLSTPAEVLSGKVHTQTISGLLPNTAYFFRLKSQYPNGLIDTHTQETTFTTSAVSLVGLPTAVADQTSVTITWTTDTSVNHGVDYGTSPGVYSHSTVPTTSAFASHSVAITNLAANTTYYYRLKSLLNTGTTVNHPESSFTTGLINLVAAPTIVLSPADAILTWSTNVATAYGIETGTETGVYTQSSPKSTTYLVDHSHTLANLIANKKYYYRIISYMPSGVSVAHGEGSFTTTSVSFAVNPAVATTSTSGDISWTTNVSTTYTLEFGLSTGVYSTATPESTTVKTLQTHSLTGLLSNKTYFYRIQSILPTGGVVIHPEGSFATAAVTITGVPGVTPQVTGADITWTTSEATNYSLDYGTVSGGYTTSVPISLTPTAPHTCSLTGLRTGTTYYYKITTHLISGEEITDIERSFITSTLSIATGPAATPSTTSAVLVWTSSATAKNIVEWGFVTGIYTNATTLSGSFSTSQSVTITGLLPATSYFYKIKSYLSTGEIVTHGEGTFTTSAFGFTVDPAVSGITTTSGGISWTTNLATKTVVDYGTSASYGTSLSIDTSATTAHSRTLSGLTPNTTYHYQIRSFASGNGDFTSGDYTFTTIAEVEPTLAKKLRGIWIVGGLSGNLIGNVVNSLDLFDPVTETWYAGAGSVSGYTPVSFAGIAAADDKIYVIGGFNSAGTAISTVQIFSITSDTWTTGMSMPAARANIQATYSNGKIYILGGTAGISSEAFVGSDTNYEYNLVGDVWNTRLAYGGANSERYSYALNDVIYNLGGRLTATAVTASAHDAYVPAYNALSGVTEVVMATNRSGLAGDIYNPSAGPAVTILIGGVSTFVGTTGNFVNQGTSTPTLSSLMQYLAYPLATPSTWTIPTSGATTYPSLIAFGSAVISTKVTPPMLYYFGGVSSLGTTTTIVASGYKCNLPTHPTWDGTWTAYPTAPTARWGHSAVTLNN